MSITRRTVLQGAIAAAAALSAGVSGATAPQPALVVYDSRLVQSQVFRSGYAAPAVDLADERANLWRNLRGRRFSGTVVGLTCWSDYVQARALLEERHLRVRMEARRGSLFCWQMGCAGNAAAYAMGSS